MEISDVPAMRPDYLVASRMRFTSRFAFSTKQLIGIIRNVPVQNRNKKKRNEPALDGMAVVFSKVLFGRFIKIVSGVCSPITSKYFFRRGRAPPNIIQHNDFVTFTTAEQSHSSQSS
jgi:hypothetical protein